MNRSRSSGALFIMLICGPIALHCLDSTASANGPTVARDSGAIFPLVSTSLQLVYENVTVFLSQDSPDVPVVCEYNLRNLTDMTQTAEMSFLINSEGASGAEYDAERQYQDTNFVVLVNGREVSVETVPAKPGAWANYLQYPTDTLPVWTVTLQPREDAHVSISYSSMMGNGGGGVEAYRYLAKAASLWAGPIEYATIRFVVGDGVISDIQENGSERSIDIYRISPGDFRLRKADVMWVRQNWEPNEDFTFVIQKKDKQTRP